MVSLLQQDHNDECSLGPQDYVVSLSNDQMGLSRIDLGVAPSEILNVAADPGTKRCKKTSGMFGSCWRLYLSHTIQLYGDFVL